MLPFRYLRSYLKQGAPATQGLRGSPYIMPPIPPYEKLTL